MKLENFVIACKRLIWTGVLCIVASQAHSQELPIGVQSSLIDFDNRLIIEMSISNLGDSPLRFYRADLPWGNKYSTLLLLVRPGKRTSFLEQAQYIDVPGPETIAIEKTQIVNGAIDVYRLFPDLNSERKKTDFLLFWAYNAKDLSGNTSRHFGGMYALPKLLPK